MARARRERRVTQEIRENPKFDYGAVGSVRQSGTGNQYENYFQKLDVERFSKIIDRHLLDTIRLFLEEKGIDTSELKQWIRAIINLGVMVEGDLHARNVQTGDGQIIDKGGGD